MNIDHHLQQAIVEALKPADAPVRYSDLKDPAIENSLFSYHLNKLIARGMVQKSDDGYLLTVEGARWVNDNGTSIRKQEAARVFMALVVQDENGNYLVGQRTGQMKAVINDYILPSVAYDNEADLPDQMHHALERFVPAGHSTSQKHRGFVQIKATYKDDKVMRALFHVTAVQVRHFDTPVARSVDYEWMSREQIDAIDHPSATILRGLIDHAVNGDDQDSPVIAG